MLPARDFRIESRAEEVGSDHSDFFARGDVSGRGLGPALLMSDTQAPSRGRPSREA